MFCIFSKSKTGDQPIAYFDTVEKAQAMIPPDAPDWYVKDIGDLKTFMASFKAERKNTSYITTKDELQIKTTTDKLDLYDTNDNLKHHLFKAQVQEDNTKEKKDIEPDEFDEMLQKRQVLSPRKVSIPYHKHKNEIDEIQHFPSVKKYNLKPTDEDGNNVFRYSFNFYDEDSKPVISKTFDSSSEADTFRNVRFLKGYIYPNKGFTIIVYEHTLSDAEKLMKEKLEKVKKEFKTKGL